MTPANITLRKVACNCDVPPSEYFKRGNYLQTGFLVVERAEVSDADIRATPEGLLGSTAHSRSFRTCRFQTDVGHHLEWNLIVWSGL